MTATPPGTIRSTDASYSEAQLRTVAAAFDLFTREGVSGTSLQMIADALGITKAAVYHQFNTKDEIVLAVAEVEMERLEQVVAAAESEPDRRRGREVLLSRSIALTVSRRHMVSLLQNDPVMVRLLATHPPFTRLMDRLFAVLIGAHPTPEERIRTAMVSAALAGAVVHPLVRGLDDDTLRSQVLDLARTLLDPPDSSGPPTGKGAHP